ncbi:MAG: proline iminopeptidase-family hydrolase [Flavisolibacter sp.]|nr:proline iminopeptidase-family hydrolase [Flavisolibacter sp.]
MPRHILLFLSTAFSLLLTGKVKGQDKDSIYYVKQKSAGVKKIFIDNTFWVWTQKIGNGRINVLLLHGGPGQTHEYFEVFLRFLPPAGITIYFYDQFGSYYSQTPTQQQLNDTSLWKISRYVDEVEQVRKGLHLNSLFVYGHSYGALLALAYTYRYPNHVQGLIFSDMNPYQQNFGEDIRLASTKTDSILSITPPYKALMQRKNNRQPYDTLLYEKVFEETFTRNFVIRMDSLSDDLVRTKNHKNQQVAEKIGPSTFSLDYTSMIKEINVPVFVMSGKYDFIIRPEETEALSKSFKNATYYIVPNGAHICFVDDAINYFPALIKFIKLHSDKQ